MKNFLIFMFCLLVLCASAQRNVQKTLDGKRISFIEINAKNCFKVEVSTHKLSKIYVEAHAEGEYQNDVLVSAKDIDGTLIIGVDFSPLFEDHNDKLSAHKVVSVSLKFILPENVDVNVLGGDTDVSISGIYKSAKTYTENGKSIFKDLKGNLQASSFKGNIFLDVENGNVKATSKFGRVENEVSESGEYSYTLNSVHGHIYIHKNE